MYNEYIIKMKTIIKLLSISLLAFILVTLISFSLPHQSSSILVNPTDSISDSLDLTSYFQKINDEKSSKITTNFRKGHVTKADLKTIVKETSLGYEIQLGRTNIPSPVAYKGKVFVSGGFGSKQYYAFDAKTGKKIWAINLDDDGPSSAAILDDVIVFNTESCTVFACNIETGEQIWSYWLGDPLMSMPTIANGIVFTAYPASYGGYNNIQQQNVLPNKDIQKLSKGINISHVMIAIELRTGNILWQKRIDGDVMSAPVAVKDKLFVSTFAGTLFKFKQKTGEIISVKSVRATSAPVIYRNQLFISQRSDASGEEVSEAIVNYNAQGITGRKVYKNKKAPYLDKNVQEKSKLKTTSLEYDAGNGFAGGAPMSSGWMSANENIGQSNVSSLQAFQGSRTLYHNGYNYNTMGDELVCTNVNSEKEQWKIKISGDIKTEGGFMGTPPIIAGNKIIIASYNGEIHLFEPKSGKLSKTNMINDNIRYQPIAQDGWIYVTTTSGKMIAINTNDNKLTGWPMWGANSARTNLSTD